MYNLYYTYINPDLFTWTLCKLWTNYQSYPLSYMKSKTNN